MIPDDRIVQFSPGDGDPQPRLTFALPEFIACELRARGFDACPTCTDPAFSRPFRGVSLEAGLHPPARPAEAAIRLAVTCCCGHCGAAARATLRFDRPVGWACIGQVVALVELGDMSPPPAPSAPPSAAPRVVARRRKGGRHGS